AGALDLRRELRGAAVAFAEAAAGRGELTRAAPPHRAVPDCGSPRPAGPGARAVPRVAGAGRRRLRPTRRTGAKSRVFGTRGGRRTGAGAQAAAWLRAVRAIATLGVLVGEEEALGPVVAAAAGRVREGTVAQPERWRW